MFFIWKTERINGERPTLKPKRGILLSYRNFKELFFDDLERMFPGNIDNVCAGGLILEG